MARRSRLPAVRGYWPLLPLVLLIGAFSLLLLARLGPSSLLLIEPIVGFGLGYLTATYLHRRVLLENQRLQAEVEILTRQNRELRAAVEGIIEEHDG
jgi:hypothetical protein